MSSIAENFIMTTDFATSKGDGHIVQSIVFPGSTSVPANSSVVFTEDINLGVRGSLIRSRIASSKLGGVFYTCSVFQVLRMGSLSSNYTLYVTVTRIAPTTLQLRVILPNPYNYTFTSESGSETFTFDISTIVPPLQ